MKAFHCSQALYRPGDVVTSGNWGRVIQGAGQKHARFYPEYALERMRSQEFPEKPSRFASCFVLDELEEAEKFRRVIEGISEHIYLVDVPDDAAIHRGDLGWIERMRECRTYEGLDACLRCYWRGVRLPEARWEVIVGSHLTIEQRLSSQPDDEFINRVQS